jgi:DNA-binding transcriptional regulator YiaG
MKRTKSERYQFLESGLVNVYLRGVPLWKCEKCDSQDVEIPDPMGLQKLIVKTLIGLDRRLRPDEFRYLRTYLGLSSKDLADRFDVSREQVSRWENGHNPIPGAEDKLLRYMAAVEKPIDDYRVVDLKKVLDARKMYTELVAAFQSDEWKLKSVTR